MGFALKLNFIKGWPNPAIHEVAALAANSTEYGQIDEGKIAVLDANEKWNITSLQGAAIAGTPSLAFRMPYILWNGAAKDGDQGVPFDVTQHFVQVQYGSIQGIAFDNPMLVETSQYTGTPAVFTELSVDLNGKLVTAVSTDLVVAIVHKAVHKIGAGVPGASASTSSLNMIGFRPLGQPYIKA